MTHQQNELTFKVLNLFEFSATGGLAIGAAVALAVLILVLKHRKHESKR